MFTIAEYIKENRLDANPRDPTAVKLIADHLRKKGLVRVRKGGRTLWVPRTEVPDYNKLKGQLGELK